MSIAVRCSNIVRYDPQLGKYLHCNHEFCVKDELAGRSVRCPRCDELVTVPEAAAAVAAPEQRAAPALAPAEPRRPAPKTGESRTVETPRVEPKKVEPAPDDYPEVLDEDEFRLSEPVALPPRDLTAVGAPGLEKPAAPRPASPSQAPEPTLPPVIQVGPAADEQAPCPGCGKPLLTRAVICPSCGYHKGLQRRVDAWEEADEERQPTGFERWLRRQMVEGDDPGAIRSMLIVAGVLLLVGGAILFLILGWLFWILVVAVGVVAAGAWLGWWKLDPWRWLLFAFRMLQWRNVIPPFAHRQVLDLRDMQIGDDELGKLQNLAEFEVLDLEGAAVTDHGLPFLYDHKNLQFIILRDTQTTPQGADRLQRALPNAWIWR